MSKTLHVGIVGYGYATRTFHAPLVAATPGMTLRAVSSSDATKVHADWPGLAVESSPEALFARDDIDLVVIPTPNQTHYPLALAALAAGKHVVVDKPVTVAVDEARRLRDAALAAGRLLSVFHNRRYDADFLGLREVLARGELGEIVHFESHFDRFRPAVRDRWRENDLPGSGLWYDLGSHLLDQAIALFGQPETIALDLACQRENARANDWFHAVLRFGACRVVLHGSALTPVPAARFAVHGRQGSFIKHGLDTQEDALKAGVRPPAPGWGDDPLPATLSVWHESVCRVREVRCPAGDYPAYYAAIRDAIGTGAPNPVPVDDAIRVIALLELGCRSMSEGRVMPVTADDWH